MTRVYLLVEGQTEEAFVRELMQPHYSGLGIYIMPILVSTSHGHKGGVTRYGKVKPQILRLCQQDANAHVSTMFDLYALPTDFPGKSEATYSRQRTGSGKAKFLEEQLAADIGARNFLPNIVVHEFEALLFAQPDRFGEWSDKPTVARLQKALTEHAGPEDINDGPTTAPSKRILQAMPTYQKTFHGPLIACEIGLDAIRQACPHFRAWLHALEALPGASAEI